MGLPWQVEAGTPLALTLETYTTLLSMTWMLVVAQWTSALWLATALKKATVPQYLPSGRTKFGLLILLVLLYGFQFWLQIPPEFEKGECRGYERNFDARITTSCYPASHMLKSLVFLLLPFVLFFCIWFSWDDAKDSVQGQDGRDTKIGKEQTRNDDAMYCSEQAVILEGCESTHAPRQTNLKDLESATVTPTVQKITKRMIPYLANIKVYLTVMVMTCHVIQLLIDSSGAIKVAPLGFTINLNALNASASTTGEIVNVAVLGFVAVNGDHFLMPTFLFISGYFTHRSFVKKGLSGFLFERAKRLSLPFVGFSFFLNPYVLSPLFSMMFVGKTYIAPVNVAAAPISMAGFTYLTNVNVCWFLGALMVFSTLYAFTSKYFEKEWKLSGSLSMFLFKVSLALSVLTFLGIETGIGNLILFGVPDFVFKIALYSAVFFGGIVAGKNKWLDDLEERLQEKRQGRKLRLIVHSFALLCVLAAPILQAVQEFGLFKYQAVHSSSDTWRCLAVGIVHAFHPVWVGMSIIIIFMDYFNWKWPDFILAGTYAAYILQPNFISLGIYAVTAAAGLGDDAVSVYNSYFGIPGPTINANLAIPYALLASSIGVSGSFLFGFALRSLPNFDKVF